MLRKISCLLPLCLLLALSSCGASPSAEQVLDQLEESIQQQDGALCFQLPAHSEDGWNILIYGRSESDGMGMSLHYLEEVRKLLLLPRTKLHRASDGCPL